MAKDSKKSKQILLACEIKNAGGKGQVFEFNEDYIEEMNFDSVKLMTELVKDLPGEKRLFVKVSGDGRIILCEPQSAHLHIIIKPDTRTE